MKHTQDSHDKILNDPSKNRNVNKTRRGSIGPVSTTATFNSITADYKRQYDREDEDEMKLHPNPKRRRSIEIEDKFDRQLF